MSRTGGGGSRLRLQDNNNGGEGVRRPIGLAGYTAAYAAFSFRRSGLDGATDYVTFDISTNNGAAWIEIARFAGPATDSAYALTNFDISAYIHTNTTIRFLTSPNMGNTDAVYFDDIQVYFTRPVTATNSGSPPPNLTTNLLPTLEPGQALTVTWTGRVDNPLFLTQVVNRATATSTFQTNPVSAWWTDRVVQLDLGVVKSVNNSNPRQGSNVVFTIVITNNGIQNATGVQYTDLITNGLTWVTNTVSVGTYNRTTGVWNVGNLAWSNSATMTITARVNTNTAGLTLTNTVRLTALNQADSNTNNNEASATLVVYGVDLGVAKFVDDNMPVVETNIAFTIILTNNGPNNATGVILTDVFPAGLVFTGAVPSQGTYTNSTGIWNVGSLAASNTATLTLTAYVPTNQAGRTLTNRISITSVNEHDIFTNNNASSATLTPRAYYLDVTKTSDAGGLVDPGDTITYTVVVTNKSDTTQTGIAIEDPVPTGATYVASSTTLTMPQYVTNVWLDQFNSRVFGNNDGNTNFTANWVESEGDGATAGDTQVIFDPVRGVTFSLQFQGGGAVRSLSRNANLSGYTNAILSFDWRRESLEAGEQAIVEATTNAGSGAWVILGRFEGAATDAGYMSTNFDIKSYIGTNTGIRFRTTNTTMGAGDIVWFDDVRISAGRKQTNSFPGGAMPTLATNVSLDPGDFIRATFQVTVDNPSTVTQVVNTVAVTGTFQSVIYAAVTDKVTYADLRITKTVSSSQPQQGVPFTYSIVMSNVTGYVASNVTASDLLPSGVTYSNHVASQGSYNRTTGVWNVGTLNVGASATLSIQAVPNPGTAFQAITNCAAVTGADKADPVLTNNESCVTIVPIFTTPDVAVTNCAYIETNGAVHIWHVAVTGQLYDLLYVDAITFADALSNRWALADQRVGTLLIDTGSATRTAPHDLGPGTMRFYRVSAPGYWETNPRYASEEVLSVGNVYVYPGFNWIRTWGIPCNNRLHDLFGGQLDGGDSIMTAPRSSWCQNFVTQEVWLADMGVTNHWLYSVPTNLANTSAEDHPVPLDRGIVITMPASAAVQRVSMIFRVPTNLQVTSIQPTNAKSLLNPNLPETLHPAQLNLLAAGFVGGANPVQSDWIWKFDRASQLVPAVIYYRTSDSSWRFTAGNGLVPTNYFRFDDAIAIQTRRSTNALSWTNLFHYTPPTLNMSP
jgi:uncharacterized repeat protein (TIGR01451 family)